MAYPARAESGQESLGLQAKGLALRFIYAAGGLLDSHPALGVGTVKYRPDIDGLRAVAILPVVLYHAGVSRLAGGFIGVDVFFVISGFLITTIIADEVNRGAFSILSFYERRARRILPALFVMMATTVLLGGLLMLPSDFHELTRSAIAATLFASNVHFLEATSYFEYGAQLKPLLHTWSLAVEEQFYLAFPAVMLGAAALRRPALPWLAVLLLLSFGLSVWGVTRFPEATFYLAPTRVWELLVGAVLALAAIPPFASRALREAAGIAGIGLILWCVLAFDDATVFPGLNALWPCLGAALIVQARGSAVSRMLSLRPMVFIGVISYSLYLWHWPVIVFARYSGHFLGTAPEIAGVLAVSAVLAVLSWRFVETPFKRRLLLPHRRQVLRATGVAMAASLALAAGLGRFGGTSEVETVAYEKGRAEARAAYGEGECFFSSDAPLTAIRPAHCLRADPARPDYLLIGDSFAAHLWPGLRQSLPDANLLQLTFGGCPPLTESPRQGDPGCRKVTRAVFDAIETTRYDVVMLAARWRPGDLAHLETTLEYLKPLAGQIVLFGPMVEYRGNLPEIIEDSASPERVVIKYRTVPEVEDRAMRALAARFGVHYVSMIELMCGGADCLLFDATGAPIQWDNAHLTPSGSVQIIDRARAQGAIPLL
jgi:peptidoglycan/LPS O-acetylase OafA/YrhL